MEEEVCSLSQVSTLKSAQLHGSFKKKKNLDLEKRNELYFVERKEVRQLSVSNHSKCLDSNPLADLGLYVESASSLPLQAFQLPPRVYRHAH